MRNVYRRIEVVRGNGKPLTVYLVSSAAKFFGFVADSWFELATGEEVAQLDYNRFVTASGDILYRASIDRSQVQRILDMRHAMRAQWSAQTAHPEVASMLSFGG